MTQAIFLVQPYVTLNVNRSYLVMVVTGVCSVRNIGILKKVQKYRKTLSVLYERTQKHASAPPGTKSHTNFRYMTSNLKISRLQDFSYQSKLSKVFPKASSGDSRKKLQRNLAVECAGILDDYGAFT